MLPSASGSPARDGCRDGCSGKTKGRHRHMAVVNRKNNGGTVDREGGRDHITALGEIAKASKADQACRSGSNGHTFWSQNEASGSGSDTQTSLDGPREPSPRS
jgi:hypothetical protein